MERGRPGIWLPARIRLLSHIKTVHIHNRRGYLKEILEQWGFYDEAACWVCRPGNFNPSSVHTVKPPN